MDFGAIDMLTAILGRTPSEKELEKYNTIYEKHNLRLKELHTDYVKALHTGTSEDNIVSVSVDYRFSVKEICASQQIEQNVLLLKIQSAMNNALDLSSKAHSNYLTKTQLIAGQLRDEVIKEFSIKTSLVDTNMDSKNLN
jgi:hypothetical protein